MLREISQYDVTWSFDRDYLCGQFITGDYWVIGPVQIVSISPATTALPLAMHGSMLNPGRSAQGYDSRIPKYDQARNVAIGVSPEHPLLLPPGSSLTSAISYVGKPPKRPFLKTVAVLTVLAQAPPDDAFRPAYTGQDKTIRHTKGRLRLDRLQRLPPTDGTPSLSVLERLFERPWIDHATYAMQHQFMAPVLNLPNYGREIAAIGGSATLALNLDYPDTAKERLLIGVLQAGIDLQGLLENDYTERWLGGGGQNSGRKWLILFAGLILDDANMQRPKGHFQEDDQTYFGHGWTGATVLWGPNHRTRQKEDYEEKQPSQWTVDGRGKPGDPKAGSNSDYRAELYRHVASSTWLGTALAARIMGAVALWDHPPFFAYMDRWMDEAWEPELHQTMRDALGERCAKLNRGVVRPDWIRSLWRQCRQATAPPGADGSAAVDSKP